MSCRQFATFLIGTVVALPAQENSHALSLLQRVAMKNDSIPNVGMSATLDEIGYQQVVEAGKLAQSHEMMEEYAGRIIERDGLYINDKIAYDEFLKYFDGACGSQSLEALIMGLHDATKKSPVCGGGWMGVINIVKPPTENEGINLLSIHHDLRHEAKLHAEVTWIFKKLHDMIFKTRSNEDAVSKQEGKRLVSSEMESPPVDENGTEIIPADQVDEHAYQRIAKENSTRMMVAFMHDILKVHGMTLIDDEKLAGMAHWYTAECGPQTLNMLRTELYRYANDSSYPGNESKSGHPFHPPTHCDNWM